MSFVNPKPGGYAFGEKLPSGHVNTIWTQSANAVDGATVGAAGLVITSRSIPRRVWAPFRPRVTSEWTLGAGGKATTAVNTAAVGDFSFKVPQSATITSWFVTIVGAGAHAGLPGAKPSCSLLRYDPATDSEAVIGSTVTDNPANTTAYQAQHNIGQVDTATPSASGLTEVVDATTYRYYLTFTSESGANALSGLLVRGAGITYTTARLDED